MDSIGALLSHSFLYNRPVLGLYPFLHSLSLSAIIHCNSIQSHSLSCLYHYYNYYHHHRFAPPISYLSTSPLLFHDIDLYQPPDLSCYQSAHLPYTPSLCLSLPQSWTTSTTHTPIQAIPQSPWTNPLLSIRQWHILPWSIPLRGVICTLNNRRRLIWWTSTTSLSWTTRNTQRTCLVRDWPRNKWKRWRLSFRLIQSQAVMLSVNWLLRQIWVCLVLLSVSSSFPPLSLGLI